MLAEKEMTLASSKDTPKRIEARFKRDERAQDGAQAMLEYLAEGRAVREKTARLRALRLAAEAGKKDAGVKAAAKPAKGSVKKAADAGKCFDTAMKEVKLPKYEKWANYEASLPANVERFCYWWGRGY